MGLPATASPAVDPRSQVDEVVCWTWPLDGAAIGGLERSMRLLAPDERQRASRFRFERDRIRFVVARAGLRRLLGERLSTAPDRLVFRYGLHGKPALAGTFDGALHFNLAHSGGFALCGIARDRELGVDLELARPLPDLEGVARVCFSPAEQDAVLAESGSLRVARFFRTWTLKESWLKGLGVGLMDGLHGVDIRDENGIGRVRRTSNAGQGGPLDAHQPDEWRLRSWCPAPDRWAAVAYPGEFELRHATFEALDGLAGVLAGGAPPLVR